MQLWRHIEREEQRGKTVRDAPTPFKAKAVYYYWHQMSKNRWKLDDDPLTSAEAYIREHGQEHNVALLDVVAPAGTRAIAFQVTDLMEAWATNTQELAMDSTCMSFP